MRSKTQPLAFALILAGALALGGAAARADEGGAAAVSDSGSYSTHYLNCNHPLGYHFTEEAMTCPIGGEKFEALQLGTYSSFGIYLDLRPVSYLGLPGPLPVCTTNGMVVTRETYTDEELKKIGAAIASDEYRKIYAGKQATYFLYAEQLRLAGLTDPAWGERWQKLVSASWEADVCHDKEKYTAYATDAVAEMRDAFKKMTPKDEFYWTVGLLIPELLRRLGDFDGAQDALNDLGGDLPENPEQKQSVALMIDLLKISIRGRNADPVQVKPPETAPPPEKKKKKK